MLGVRKDYGKDVNKWLKAIIVDFGKDVDPNEYVVTNDNFGKRRKYPDFTEGKKAAGLNPWQVVYSGLVSEAKSDSKFIGKDDKIHSFREVVPGHTIVERVSADRTVEGWDTLENIEKLKEANLLVEIKD